MNEKNQELVTKDDKPIAAQPVSDAGSMLAMIGQMATNKDVDIDKVERLMALQVQMQERENEKAFNDAMSRAQSKMEVVAKNKENTHTRSTYADLGADLKMAVPIYTRHGINVSYNTGKIADDSLPMIAYVSACGHTREYCYDSPVTSTGTQGKQMMTAQHARKSAVSYGKRILVEMIFNLASEDDDGNAATPQQVERISTEQAATLHSMLEEKGAQEGKLLTWYNFKAKTNINAIKDIAASFYDSVVTGIEGFHSENG